MKINMIERKATMHPCKYLKRPPFSLGINKKGRTGNYLNKSRELCFTL